MKNDETLQPITKPLISTSMKKDIRILVAEDNLVNQRVVERMLEKIGYSSDVVANGLEAVSAIESIPYNLVFMDIQMPKMDGFEATSIIREKEKITHRHVPIIAMTAYALKGDRERCIEAGMDNYIAKPIKPEDIGMIMAMYLVPEQQALTVAGQPAIIQSFDKTSLLERLSGDREFCKEIVDLFVQDFPHQLVVLKKALREKDGSMIEKHGHKIKGASANAEAQIMKEIAREIEKYGKKNDIGKILPLIERLEEEFERLKAEALIIDEEAMMHDTDQEQGGPRI